MAFQSSFFFAFFSSSSFLLFIFLHDAFRDCSSETGSSTQMQQRCGTLKRCFEAFRGWLYAAVRIPWVPLQQATLNSYNFVSFFCYSFCSNIRFLFSLSLYVSPSPVPLPPFPYWSSFVISFTFFVSVKERRNIHFEFFMMIDRITSYYFSYILFYFIVLRFKHSTSCSNQSLCAHLEQHVGEIAVGEFEVSFIIELQQSWAVRVLIFQV